MICLQEAMKQVPWVPATEVGPYTLHPFAVFRKYTLQITYCTMQVVKDDAENEK